LELDDDLLHALLPEDASENLHQARDFDDIFNFQMLVDSLVSLSEQ
jgi:hypothetical protein